MSVREYREAREQHEQRRAGDDPITRIIRSRVPLGSIRRRRRDHASATGSSDAGTPPSPARRRRRGGDGDENSRRGAGNISGRTSRGLTKPYGAERPRRTRDGPERTSPSVPAGQRHTDRECDEGHGGDERVRQSGGEEAPHVPGPYPVGSQSVPSRGRPITATAERRRVRHRSIPPNSAVTRNPSLQAGPASPASVTVRTTPVRYGTESAIETPTYEVRSRPFGERAEQFPEARRRREGRTVPRRRGRERGTARASTASRRPSPRRPGRTR